MFYSGIKCGMFVTVATLFVLVPSIAVLFSPLDLNFQLSYNTPPYMKVVVGLVLVSNIYFVVTYIRSSARKAD